MRKASVFHVILGLCVIVATGFLLMRREAFTSPGTMVQLSTSHVPTEEDAYFYKFVYPRQVRKEIARMTGEA